MSNAFAPNKNGLVVVVLKSNYGSNVAGEKAGFLPEVAKELVKKGHATLPGRATEKPVEVKVEEPKGSELTTRKFRPAQHPLDHDGDGKKGGSLPAEQRVVPGSATDNLRAEYKELTGKVPDSRWGAGRLAVEIDKIRSADDAEQADA